ncbi:hypothetical protein [Methylosinus trichosporium]|nr:MULTISPECIES: hypothetical protein [Methylosinus]
MNVTSGDWCMLASYFPQGSAKAAFFAACHDAAKERADFPFAIIGDFNTGNQLHDRDNNGERYACAEKFDALSSKLNLSDLWRRTNGVSAREWSWKSNAGNGFRIDHAFANQKFIDRYHPSCHYDHEPRELGSTDHSALIVTCMK